MKKLLQLTGIASMILVMASCGSMNSFTKKHHSHRKWKKAETAEVVDKQGVNKGITEPTTRRGVAADTPEEPKQVQPQRNRTPQIVETPAESNAEEPTNIQDGYTSPSDDVILDNDVSEEQTNYQEEEVAHVEERPRGVTSTENTTDEMTILLVIIAIIGLPWLSMLLYEGATMRTILILILSLIGYGWFFTPFLSIALLVAIVWTVLILLGFA